MNGYDMAHLCDGGENCRVAIKKELESYPAGKWTRQSDNGWWEYLTPAGWWNSFPSYDLMVDDILDLHNLPYP